MYLEEICKDVQLENGQIECKRKLNRSDIIGWLKTVAGFANASGGELYIGVEDKTNKLIGFEKKNLDIERNYFNNQVNEHLTPIPRIKISFIPYNIRNQERFIIQVSVQESTVKPVILKYKNVPSIYMRREGFTNGATYEEIIEMGIKSKNSQYDILSSTVKYNFKKLLTLREFYKDHNNGKELTEKTLKSMGFMDDKGYLTNGAVLFLDDYQEDKTLVQCSLFGGVNRGSERIVTINKFRGNIIHQVNSVMEFIKQRMNRSIVKLNDSHVEIDAYPERSLFEGVINALAHRDYYLDGTQIQVDMFKDRLEISSPGGFYRGEKFDKTYELSKIISKRRNELISNVLVACNVMEASGTGFEKIMEDYKNADEPHRPYIYSASDHFTLVLPDLTYVNGVEDDSILPITFIPVSNGTSLDEKVLSYCYSKARSVSQIASYLGIKDSTYLRKNVLLNLVKNKYLEQSKLSRTSYYKTNPKMVSVC